MSQKKALVAGALIAIVAITAFTLHRMNRPPEEDVVRIGGVLPLTGDAGTFGQNTSRGAQLAVEIANAQRIGGNTRFAFVEEDSRGDAAQAVSAGTKLIDSNGVQMLIGDVTSAGTHALVPIAERNRIPLISPSASDPSFSGISPFFCRAWPSDDFEARVVGQHALDKGYGKLAFVYANTDYGVAMVDELKKVIGEDRIALSIPVERETQSFRPTVQRIVQSESDALFMVLYPEDARRFLQQLEEANVTLPILATATFEDPSLLDLKLAENVIFASPKAADDQSTHRRDFIAQYRERYGEDPGVLSDVGYDCAMILIRAYSESQSPDSIMTHIKELNSYPGVSGELSFDEQGDVLKPYGLKTVSQGAFVWLE